MSRRVEHRVTEIPSQGKNRDSLITRVKKRLHGQVPSEKLGQNFLVNEERIEQITRLVIPKAEVVEIGAGPGHLTERLARVANKVHAIEVDPKFESNLRQVAKRTGNVEIIIGDAQRVNLSEILGSDPDAIRQLVSNLPFHITEPVIRDMAALDIESAVLVIGSKAANEITTVNPNSLDFGKNAFVAQTISRPIKVADISREEFWPQPRTDAALIVMEKRNEEEYSGNMGLSVARQLVINDHTSQTVRKAISLAVSNSEGSKHRSKGKKEGNRASRREQRRETKASLQQINRGFSYEDEGSAVKSPVQRYLEKVRLPNDILDRPFNKLDNTAIRRLARAIFGSRNG